MNVTLEQVDTDKIQLTGVLNFDTVPALRIRLVQLLPQMASMVIDLSHVTYCDSSGVALMLECLRMAKQANKKVTFMHVPAQLRAIADMTGIAKLLKLQVTDVK